jgi:hypothetical protein
MFETSYGRGLFCAFFRSTAGRLRSGLLDLAHFESVGIARIGHGDFQILDKKASRRILLKTEFGLWRGLE